MVTELGSSRLPRNERTRTFWQACVESGAVGIDRAPNPPEAWAFGEGRAMADELGSLVQRGIKTATCSLLWEYEADDEPLPQAGDLSIITDGDGDPLCVIETTDVEIKPFDQVDAQFAYDEGEGDRSLAFWRDAHWQFFARLCETLGCEPSATMPLVCERFRVLFKA